MLHDVHMSTSSEEQPPKEERYSGALLLRTVTYRLWKAIWRNGCLNLGNGAGWGAGGWLRRAWTVQSRVPGWPWGCSHLLGSCICGAESATQADGELMSDFSPKASKCPFPLECCQTKACSWIKMSWPQTLEDPLDGCSPFPSTHLCRDIASRAELEVGAIKFCCF